jgi:enamine deaminase RidA (YjgF/YER057c/UK114 family)
MTRLALIALAAALLAAPRDKKKDEEPPTQALQSPPELPAATIADAGHLVFLVTPLRGDGLLSAQLREALRPLIQKDRPLVKLRAFVAGTGDTRRVQTVVSEVLTERHAALPALTAVQVGLLPRDGAQVVLEAVAVDKRTVNPGGVLVVPAETDLESQPLQPVLPHLREVLERLGDSLPQAGALRVTCYATSLDEIGPLQEAVAAAFPQAVANFVQPERATLVTGATCEAVGRASASSPGRIVFTGAQLAFGSTPADARLAFERLGKTLAGAGASYSRVVHLSVYALSRAAAELAASAGREFFDPAAPPALTIVRVEGLPSLDASFAIDAEAALP